jgi:apolipoprotein N-acyltransferase
MTGAAGLVASFTVLWGWRRLLAAALAGAASALAMAPLLLAPVLFVTFPVLVWLLDGVSESGPGRRLGVHLQAFWTGWAFGFGYFLAGLHWIGSAFLVDADVYGWLLPVAVVALPAGLAVFPGFATLLARLAWLPGFGRVLALAAAWTLMEGARATVLTGFPWNQIGQVFVVSDAFMQAAAWVGGLGLSFAAVAVAAAPATMADRRTGPTVLAVTVLAALWAGGAWRLSGASDATVDGVRIRIVQPAIAQASKWDPANRSGIVAAYLELSDLATSPETMGIDGVTHLIWPETALPLLLEQESEVAASIAALLPPETMLLMGGLHAEPGAPGRRNVYNSVFAIGSDGKSVARYDKRHLVPFGEYLPFQAELESWGLSQLTRLRGGFTAGDGEAFMAVGAGPAFIPLICYEIIFPAPPLRAGTGAAAGWILNLTNDAWFGNTSGPYQHLAQARLRAVEEGLPVIRAANTGISAIIDPYGRLQGSLAIGQRGVLDGRIPAEIPPTVFARIGLLPVIVVAALLVLGLFFLSYSRKHT